jgi:signal transduction histidine kinase
VQIARDVTELQRAQAALAEQAAELEAIFEAMADGVMVHDKEGRVMRTNRAWQAIFRAFADLNDWSADSTFAALPFAQQVKRWHDSVRELQYPLHDVDGHVMPLEQTPTYRALRGDTVTGSNAVDERFERADGHVYVVSVSAAPLRDAAGSIVGAVSVARDVTAQRQLERQVREQAAQLEATFAAMTDAVAVFDLQGRYVHANSALRQLLGFDADAEYAALPPDGRAQRLQFFDEQGQLIPLEQWPQWRVLRGEILAGASAVEGRLQTLDGRERWISTTGALIRASDEQASGVVLITRDVTARRTLERQAAEQAAEQAAAAERTRLAHELHDTVTQEIYSAGLLADSITRNWPEHRADAEAALAQLPGLIRSALAGLRVLLLELRPTTLDDLPLAALLHQLAEAMSTRAQVPIAVLLNVGHGASNGAETTEETEPPLPPEVKEVFYRVAQEALMNAAKYARARTISVQVRTRIRGQSAGRGKSTGTSRSDMGTATQGARRTVELAIVDDGQGFDPSAIASGHFGLAIMRERAHAVGATVQIRSQPGHGTQIVAAWPNGHSTGRSTGRALQAAALHKKVAPHG